MRPLPVALFGAVMGLAGLGVAARATAPVLPGLVRAPAYFTEPWVLLGLLALLVLLPLYLLKVVLHPQAVREDFTNPALLGFCGALPVGISLVAAGVAPYLPAPAEALWWFSVGLMFSFQLWAVYRWLSGGVELMQLNAGWLILLGGGIVLASPGLALGHAETARVAFGVSAVAASGLMVLLFLRALIRPPLSATLSPSWFILLMPPSLIYANGVALYDSAVLLESLFFFGLLLAVALIMYARRSMDWSLGADWWALTFPLDALAYAAARYAQDHPALLWRSVAGLTLLLATAIVATAFLRMLFRSGRDLGPPEEHRS